MFEDSTQTAELDLPVVAVGASAGGLDALKKLFSKIPTNTGVAFVVIQHLDPNHESLLVDLISPVTKLDVEQAEDGKLVEADHLYIIPPDSYLSISGGVLHLQKPIERRGMRMPIDYFFRSLAEDLHERAICIILSGTGSDGTLGLRQIKENGGMGIVQDPAEADYNGMPRSAINTGLVDYVARSEDMPEALLKYVNHPYVKANGTDRDIEAEPTDNLDKILGVLRDRTSYDFRHYKKNTLVRRIERRMSLCSVEDMEEYLGRLREDDNEKDLLFKDVLISVTRFFRDSDAIETLESEIIPRIIDRDGSDRPIRVWVPGCATGEEAYTIAILLIEACNNANISPEIQVFATDIDVAALDFARTGIYLDTIAADVSAERLKRYFVKDNDAYKVNKQLRDSVIFAVQNLISDPPFSRLDLISCRNLLIYIEPNTQQRVMNLFHLALKDSGYLFLGTSETVGRSGELFRQISKPHRIYQRKSVQHRINMDFSTTEPEKQEPRVDIRAKREQHLHTLEQVTKNLLLEHFAPASVVVNQENVVEYFFGETDRFLAQPAGEPTMDIFVLCRRGLRTKLRASLYRARQDMETTILEDVQVLYGGHYNPTRLTIQPIDKLEDGKMLISFFEQPIDDSALSTAEQDVLDEDSALQQLEDQLQSAQEELQSTIEEMETSNEELKASNEEVMSMNEVLQSTNEELETSKEELQSLNEELTTVNGELHAKIDQLETANNDFVNLLASTDIATVFLDTGLKIKLFTPSMNKLQHLIPSDVNRPLSDVTLTVDDPDLIEDANKVLDDLTPIETEVAGPRNRWYIRRILPYRTHDNKIEGVVINYNDVSLIKNAEQKIVQSEQNLVEAQRIAQLGSWIWDIKTDTLTWSEETYRIFGKKKNTFGHTYSDYFKIIHSEDREFVQTSHGQALAGEGVYDVHYRIVMQDGSIKFIHGMGEVEFDEHKNAVRIVGTVQDVTSILLNIERQRSFIEKAPIAIAMFDEDMRYVAASQLWLKDYGIEDDNLVGTSHYEVHDDVSDELREAHQRGLKGEIFRKSFDEVSLPDGSTRWNNWALYPWYRTDQSVGGIIIVAEDVTAQKIGEKNLQAKNTRLEQLVLERTEELNRSKLLAEDASNAKSEFLSLMSHELRTPLNAIMGFGEVLQLNEPLMQDKKTSEPVRVILESSEHLLHLITQILDLSGIESGKISLNTEIVAVEEIISAAVDLTSVLAQKKNISIKVLCDVPDALVKADEWRARQVMINLLSNSIKYNRVGGTVKVDGFVADNHMFRVSITDDGYGISESFKEDIFKPFSRDHRSLTEGTGIGLSISKDLVERMGGRMSYSSEQGKGSVFWFELPVGHLEDTANAVTSTTTESLPEHPEPPPPEVPGDTKILYIEDNEPNQKLMQTIIEQVLGIQIDTALSAEEGLEKCQLEWPDQVLMDIRLPGMSGLKATQAIREMANGRDLSIITVSGDALDENIQEAISAGADAHVTKPFKINEVVSVIRRMLQQQREKAD